MFLATLSANLSRDSQLPFLHPPSWHPRNRLSMTQARFSSATTFSRWASLGCGWAQEEVCCRRDSFAKTLAHSHHPRPAHSVNPSVHLRPFQTQRQYKTTSHPSTHERCLMATSPKSTVHNRKRKHAEVELSQDDLPSLPSKKFKPPPAFWDNLSKIWLTRSSLKELNRRNAQSTSYQSSLKYKIRKPRTRSAVREFKQKVQPAVPVSEYLSKAPQVDIALLKTFARKGGPDLTDLRGVCTNLYH